MGNKYFVNSLFFLITTFLLLGSNSYSSENQNIVALGDQNAKIKIKVFSSLTCPHCATFHKKIIKKLEKEFIEKKLLDLNIMVFHWILLH